MHVAVALLAEFSIALDLDLTRFSSVRVLFRRSVLQSTDTHIEASGFVRRFQNNEEQCSKP